MLVLEERQQPADLMLGKVTLGIPYDKDRPWLFGIIREANIGLGCSDFSTFRQGDIIHVSLAFL